jgi:hypothetical protein
MEHKRAAMIPDRLFQDRDCGIGQSGTHSLNIGRPRPFANADGA